MNTLRLPSHVVTLLLSVMCITFYHTHTFFIFRMIYGVGSLSQLIHEDNFSHHLVRIGIIVNC